MNAERVYYFLMGWGAGMTTAGLISLVGGWDYSYVLTGAAILGFLGAVWAAGRGRR